VKIWGAPTEGLQFCCRVNFDSTPYSKEDCEDRSRKPVIYVNPVQDDEQAGHSTERGQ
jgi:hypothetical protein